MRSSFAIYILALCACFADGRLKGWKADSKQQSLQNAVEHHNSETEMGIGDDKGDYKAYYPEDYPRYTPDPPADYEPVHPKNCAGDAVGVVT